MSEADTARSNAQTLSPEGEPHILVAGPRFEAVETSVSLKSETEVEFEQVGQRATLRASLEPDKRTIRLERMVTDESALINGGLPEASLHEISLYNAQLNAWGDALQGVADGDLDRHLVSAATWEALRDDPREAIDEREVVHFSSLGLRLERALTGSLKKPDSIKPRLSGPVLVTR